MTPEREARIREVCARRQPDLCVILENVHDPHNISAVLRSCDAVGVQSVHVVYTDPDLTEERLLLGRKSSASAWKWVDVYYHEDLATCVETVRGQCDRILAAHVGEAAQSLYETDLTVPTALLFGNERDGVSAEALACADGQIFIPQMGMIRSLNISVACAVCLYEACRQRGEKGFYQQHPTRTATELEVLVTDFIERHETRARRKVIRKKS